MPDNQHRISPHMTQRARSLRRDMTFPEVQLWQELKARQMAAFKFRKQAVIGSFIVDFFCPAAELVIEIDGETHDDPEKDAARDRVLETRGLRVVRYTNDEVIHELDWVLDDLWKRLTGGGESPSPTPP